MGQKKSRERKREGENIERNDREGFYPAWIVNYSDTGCFGCSIKFQGPYLIVIVDMEEKDKIKEVIKKLKDHANFVIGQYENSGIFIERICVVDSDEIMGQINNFAIDSSKFDEGGKQDMTLEVTDYYENNKV